jgi:NAD+ kinase
VRFGFVVHGGREAAVSAAGRLMTWTRERDHQVVVLEDDGPVPAAVDLVVSVGGDGTLLRAALWGHRTGAPVLGVKVGRVGFLTEVEPDGAPGLLEA